MKKWFHNPKNFRTGASPCDTVLHHGKDTLNKNVVAVLINNNKTERESERDFNDHREML